MKTKLLLLVGLTLFYFLNTFAQTNQVSDCQTLQKTVENYLKSPNQSKSKNKELFKTVKLCAESGSAEAACNLGIFYKDGIGCKLNFDQSKKWFEKSYELGNQKAAYSLGYLYLKGLGSVNQDYTTAVQWFKISDYPMAKHWLAQCYYFGYGVPQDISKALQMLKDNPIGNSQVLLKQFVSEQKQLVNLKEDVTTGSLSQSVKNTTADDLSNISSPAVISSENVIGEWSGELLEMDWSGEKLIRRLPLSIIISSSPGEIFQTKFTIGEKYFLGDALLVNNELIFPNLNFELPKQYTDHPEMLSLDYRILNLRFFIKNNLLTGRLTTNIETWSEPGPPLYIQLSKSNKDFDEEALNAFKQQEDSFIKIYPNPVDDDFLIRYTLDTDSRVRLFIQDYYGRTGPMLLNDDAQKKGEQTKSYDNLANLSSGLYTIRLEINDMSYTKIIIKK